jgi:hypothetical protein
VRIPHPASKSHAGINAKASRYARILRLLSFYRESAQHAVDACQHFIKKYAPMQKNVANRRKMLIYLRIVG